MLKTVAEVKRNITNPYYFFEYSVFCLITSVLLFGWLSFGVFIKELGQNKTNLSETRDEVKRLRDIKFGLIDLQAGVSQAQPYLLSLESEVPDSPQIDAFLLDFIPLAANEGFGLSKVVTSPSQDPYVTHLTVELNGDPKNLHKLISALESASRYVSIYSVNGAVTSVSRVNLEIKVFHVSPDSIDFTQIKDARIDIEFLSKEFTPVHERN